MKQESAFWEENAVEWQKLWQKGKTWLQKLTQDEPKTNIPDTSEVIREVMRQWQEAYALWQTSNDDDLIDAAIFRIKAAEKQYVYLLKQTVGKEPVANRPQEGEGL